MLKVDPGDRPSAEDLLVHRLPPLMVQFMEEEFALAEDTGDRGIANTRWVCHGRGVWWVCLCGCVMVYSIVYLLC